jgi:DNA (cytosine-5)-methyltransferase 1
MSRSYKVKELVSFARMNQRRVFDVDSYASSVYESATGYQTELERAGLCVLTFESQPHLLSQGQFMFWPIDDAHPSRLSGGDHVYCSPANKRPIAIDLFAGAGGLSLGFEQAGFDVAACVEIDPIHCATHEFNFPYSASICADVRELTGQLIRERSGIADRPVDVVCGGAPCQGFSLIGKRAFDDPRNQLVYHYVRLVKDLAPKYCVFENVKGLTVGNHVTFLHELIEALQLIGYQVVQPYRVLNAAHYGVPQNRQRLFLLAYREDQVPPVYPIEQQRKVTVGEAIGDLPNADDFEELMDSDTTHVKWKPKSLYSKYLKGVEHDPADFSYSRTYNPDLLTSSLRTTHTAESMRRFECAESGMTEPISRFFKLDLKGLCNTLRAGTDSARGAFTSPRPIHPLYPRVITVREAARIHSYPDWFRFHVTKWHGFRQIGNSVPPLLGRAVASEIIHALGISPKYHTKPIALGNPALLSLDMKQAANHFSVSSTVIAQRTRKKEMVAV